MSGASAQPPESVQIEPSERVKAVVALDVLLMVFRVTVDCFPGDDLETVLVYLTVAAASTSSHTRDRDVFKVLGEGPLPDHLHRPISGRAVAQASGLARETVRRRLEVLVAQGRLARDQRGFRSISNSLTHGRNLEFARRLIRELRGADGRLARVDSLRRATPLP